MKKINQKGITMVTLTIAIVILVIVSNILIYNAKDGVYANRLESMYNDIASLRNKVIEYYMEYGKLPVNSDVEYSVADKEDLLENWISDEEYRAGKFFVIDLKALEGVTLSYGKDYEKFTKDMSTEEVSKLTDIYIVNNVSQNVFYVSGINVDGKKYYSDRKKDNTVIDLKFYDGIEIPEGYSYVSGTKDLDLTIINNTTKNKYKWISVSESIDALPDGVKVENEQEFIDSVNEKGGYFLCDEDIAENVAYIPLS